MYIIATFEQTIYLELAITALQEKGIDKDKILAVPLQKKSKVRHLFDTIHQSDGFSMLDFSAILGTVFMLLGSIYGYVWKWGPILWGIIGAVFGIIAGLALKWLTLKKTRFEMKKITSEVVVMVHCGEGQRETIENVLWDNQALGLARLKVGNSIS